MPALTVRKKLVTGFGAVFALLALAIALSLSTMGRLNEDTTMLGNQALPAVALNGEIGNRLEVFRLAQTSLLLSAEDVPSAVEVRRRSG
jgi:hypothetical protein